jgi:hypothetical protein
MSIALGSVAWLAAKTLLVAMDWHRAAMIANRKSARQRPGCDMREIIAPHSNRQTSGCSVIFFKVQNSTGISAILVIHAVICVATFSRQAPVANHVQVKPSSF